MTNGISPPSITISVGDWSVIVFIGSGSMFITCCLMMHVVAPSGHNSILSAVVPAVFLFTMISNMNSSVFGLKNSFAGFVQILAPA